MGNPVELPQYQHQHEIPRKAQSRKKWLSILLPFVVLAYLLPTSTTRVSTLKESTILPSPYQVETFKSALAKCYDLTLVPGAPANFADGRKVSDRFVEGTKPVLIKNATVWTGEEEGKQYLSQTDLYLDGGVIVQIGKDLTSESFAKDVVVIDAAGAYVTPGLVDLHSHAGVGSAPGLAGASDTNSRQNPILPYLRSLDGYNTHDLARHRIAGGGVTTSLVLPGSANNIGGQAYLFKHRETAQKTPISMTVEPPFNIPNVTESADAQAYAAAGRLRWRHMKGACGENIRRVYGQVRLDLAWNFRSAFEKARQIKESQDAFCSKAAQAASTGQVLTEKFPEDLQWEALVDLLRGRVKLNTHCYETTDFDAMIRHSNEFKFPIAAFHHAHEAYLLPDRLKETYGGTPAIAMFATNMRYKREAYRGSEFAGKILYENNVPVVYKSDHAVLDSRYLIYEAAQGHHFGLPEHAALSSVITTSAKAAGIDHRLGFIRPGYDADIVLWDSHPLSLGASPTQVWIDGIPQIKESYPTKGDARSLTSPAPSSANYDTTVVADLADEEEESTMTVTGDFTHSIVFTNISEVFVKQPSSGKIQSFLTAATNGPLTLVVENNKIVCLGVHCDGYTGSAESKSVNLHYGSIVPPATVFGGNLGLEEIPPEQSTIDGSVYDPLTSTSQVSDLKGYFAVDVPVRAVDGLSFGGKNIKTTYESGITKAISAPVGNGFFSGISTIFKTDAVHALEKGAVVQQEVALHVSLKHGAVSISTQIAALRRLLSSEDTSFTKAAKGLVPLFVTVEKADHIASLITLKKSFPSLKLSLAGATEAHLVAEELAEEEISVIITRPRCYPGSWDTKRCLDGPPLSPTSLPVYLSSKNVTVALGASGAWTTRHLFWEAGMAYLNSDQRVSRSDALDWISSNVEKIFGLQEQIQSFEVGSDVTEFVAFEGDPFNFGSRVVAIADGERGIRVL